VDFFDAIVGTPVGAKSVPDVYGSGVPEIAVLMSRPTEHDQ
jgi:hypothetical protein